MSLKHVILTALIQGEMTGYEITKEFDLVFGYFVRASHQQVYRELGRLRENGWASCREVEQFGKPNKKVYALTEAGLDELRRWMGEPLEPKPQRDDLLVKLVASVVTGPESLRAEFVRQRARSERLLEEFRAIECEHCVAPSEEWSPYLQHLYLTLRKGLIMEEARLTWIAEVEEFLGEP